MLSLLTNTTFNLLNFSYVLHKHTVYSANETATRSKFLALHPCNIVLPWHSSNRHHIPLRSQRTLGGKYQLEFCRTPCLTPPLSCPALSGYGRTPSQWLVVQCTLWSHCLLFSTHDSSTCSFSYRRKRSPRCFRG